MYLRAVISCFLVLTLITVYSTGSLAAPGEFGSVAGGESMAAAEAMGAQEPAGTLTATGQVSVNGNTVRTGATVLNGSTIAAGPDGDASIDLGPLGRIQIRPNTVIKLVLASNSCQVIMERCGSLTQVVPSGVNAQVKMAKFEPTEVAVTRSEVRLKTGDGKDGTLVKTDENKVLDNLQEIATTGDAVFTVNCCSGCEPAGGYFFPVAGLFALVGVGAAIAVGVVVGGPDGGKPKVSPVI